MKKNLRWLGLLLAGCMLLAGCSALTQEETEPAATGKFPWPNLQPATQPTQQTEPDPYDALEGLRASMGREQNAAVAYLGQFDEPSADLMGALEEAVPEFCQQYPFVLQTSTDRILGSSGELYCIITREAEAAIAISKSVDGEYTYNEGLAILEGAEPVLLFVNSGGWAPDTLVNVTDSTGTYNWYPMLNDYLCTAHMLDEDWNNRLLDITPYTEQLRQSYLQRLEDGWKVPSQDDLLGKTWTCKEWTNDGAEHSYTLSFGDVTADVRWNNGYDAQDHEYGAPYSLTFQDEFAVISFDFGEFAGEQVFNILIDEESGMLYTMLDVTGKPVQSGFDRLYRTLE